MFERSFSGSYFLWSVHDSFYSGSFENPWTLINEIVTFCSISCFVKTSVTVLLIITSKKWTWKSVKISTVNLSFCQKRWVSRKRYRCFLVSSAVRCYLCKSHFYRDIVLFCFVILFNVGHNTKVAHIYLHMQLLI